MKGVVISSETSTQMTTDYRLFTTALISHAASKGYKRWPGVLENMELLKSTIWDITRPNKKQHPEILTTEIKGAGSHVISKQEWIVMDCVLEAELEDNYNNELRLTLPEKALFRKQGDAIYGIIYDQLGSNVIAAA